MNTSPPTPRLRAGFLASAMTLLMATVGLSGEVAAAPPAIAYVVCPTLPNGPEFICTAVYTSSTAVTVQWSGAYGTSDAAPGLSRFYGQCANGDSVRMTVTVTNADGSSSKSTSRYRCVVAP
jgi:hypothetical protein